MMCRRAFEFCKPFEFNLFTLRGYRFAAKYDWTLWNNLQFLRVFILEHLYGTLVRKSQTPVYGSVMKPIPDQLDIQDTNTATNSRKPKGILKNSKQTDVGGSSGSCSSFTTTTTTAGNSKTPLSPMSDIVVTYSHKENIETLSTSRH